MVRVLLLTDSHLDFQTRRAVASLGRDLGGEFQVTVQNLIRGPMATVRNFQLARRLRAEKFDLVHAHGTSALTLAAIIHTGPIVFSFRDFPTARRIKWVRAVMGYRAVHVVCQTATMQRFCVERGVPIDNCHLIRPGVEFGRIHRRRDPKLRLALGFSETDIVFLTPGEATRGAKLTDAVWAVSILNVLDPKHRLLVWGPGDRTRRAVKFTDQLGEFAMLAVAEKRLGRKIEFEELLAAADMVVITAEGSVSTLPIAICMAAGLPIVSTVTSEVAELLEDRHTALFVAERSPRAIAQRLQDLLADKGLQWRLADMAKTEAYEYFANTRFMNQYRGLYQQVATGGAVAVPQTAPGAGLRFHGLA